MKFIQRDVNKRLLVFIIILITLLTSITIYYTFSFNKLLAKYNKNQELFEEMTANVVVKTIPNNSLSQDYKEYFEKKYDDLNTLNKNLIDEIINLKSQIIALKSQVEYQKAKDDGTSEQFLLFQRKNDEIKKLREEIANLCSEFEKYNITSKGCG